MTGRARARNGAGPMSDDLSSRVSKLETDMGSLNTRVAVTDTKLDHVSADTAAIRSDIKKLVWIIIGAIATAGMAFVLNGGMAVG